MMKRGAPIILSYAATCEHGLQSARSKCGVLSPLSFSDNKAAAAVLFYSTMRLLFQVRPANNIKSGCLSSCAQCEVLLAGGEGGGAKLSTQHAARSQAAGVIRASLTWTEKRHNGSVGARKWNNGFSLLLEFVFLTGCSHGSGASLTAWKPCRPGCGYTRR